MAMSSYNLVVILRAMMELPEVDGKKLVLKQTRRTPPFPSPPTSFGATGISSLILSSDEFLGFYTITKQIMSPLPGKLVVDSWKKVKEIPDYEVVAGALLFKR